MPDLQPTVLVTGVAGNLGVRLLPLLRGWRVVGVDMHTPPSLDGLEHFEQLDLGRESSCDELIRLIREHQVSAVIHLAFVIDPLRTGVLDRDRMWQINVAGTSRVMEAIAEVNRHGGRVTHFLFPGSVSAYGPETPESVKEDFPLGAKSLPYALHKKECDEVVQARAKKLNACTTYILRPHIFVGASVNNYLVGALRGTPTGNGRLAGRARAKGTRLPLLLPQGRSYPGKKIQFVHVDDMARLLAFLLKRHDAPGLQILNVAGRGKALTMSQCAALANAKVLRLPTRFLCRLLLKVMWQIGLSGVPPEAFPYIVGSYTMDTTRLQTFLGDKYEDIIRYTVEEALLDSFQTPATPPEIRQDAATSVSR